MHRLTTSFILGYHGCDQDVGERLLAGEAFQPSSNDYDWLGPGTYFWEVNPRRGIEFAIECAKRPQSHIRRPTVVGAVIELGNCLDLTTSSGIQFLRDGYDDLVESFKETGSSMPVNAGDGLRRRLDCAVITRIHTMLQSAGVSPIDTVKAIFFEGQPVYPGAGFYEKTHTQIAVCNPSCIRGVFRVAADQLR